MSVDQMGLIKKYFPPHAQKDAYNVMMAESGGQNIPSHYNKYGTEDSHGLFQINLQAHPQMRDKVYNREENVKYAAKLFNEQGWNPWPNTAHKLGLLGSNIAQSVGRTIGNVFNPQKATVSQPNQSATQVGTTRVNPQDITPQQIQQFQQQADQTHQNRMNRQFANTPINWPGYKQMQQQGAFNTPQTFDVNSLIEALKKILGVPDLVSPMSKGNNINE